MIKIIETNINDEDFQSRIIEVPSWEYVIDLFEQEDVEYPKTFTSIIGNYYGVIRPRFSKIHNLKYTDIRLCCGVETYDKVIITKLIQRIC